MSIKRTDFTRRDALKLAAGAAAAGFGMPWTIGGAFAQQARPCGRASPAST